jgi:hypothetical protein
VPAQPEEGAAAKAARFAAGGAGGRDSRLYYATIKIETPEASVSGVFNLRAIFPAAAELPMLWFVSYRNPTGLAVASRNRKNVKRNARNKAAVDWNWLSGEIVIAVVDLHR